MSDANCALKRELTQVERLRRFGEIQDERLELETRLLHLDAEESLILALCEHTTGEGEALVENVCQICGAALEPIVKFPRSV